MEPDRRSFTCLTPPWEELGAEGIDFFYLENKDRQKKRKGCMCWFCFVFLKHPKKDSGRVNLLLPIFPPAWSGEVIWALANDIMLMCWCQNATARLGSHVWQPQQQSLGQSCWDVFAFWLRHFKTPVTLFHFETDRKQQAIFDWEY